MCIRHAFRAFIAGLAVLAAAPAWAADDPPAKTAVIFLDPGASTLDLLFETPRVVAETTYYDLKGYRVLMKRATTENIAGALRARNVRAFSFFGHGDDVREDPNAKSTMLSLSADQWSRHMYLNYLQSLSRDGIPIEEAECIARRKVLNFGLAQFRNHSCASLVDTDLAQQFVAPGGSYEGVEGYYVPCFSPKQIYSDVDFVLDDYRVPLDVVTKRMEALPDKCKPEGDKLFSDPQIGGVPVHVCLDASGETCGDAVAIRFCQEQGYIGAGSWLYGSAKAQTVHIDDGSLCSKKTEAGEWDCTSIINVVCRGFGSPSAGQPVGNVSLMPSGPPPAAVPPAEPAERQPASGGGLDSGGITDLLRGQ